NTPFFKANRDVLDQRALIGQRLGADDMPIDPPCVRRRKDLFRRNIGVAGDPVLRRGAPALPLMSVRKPDGEVGTWSREMQRTESLPVQPLPPATQYFVMRFPGGNGVFPVDAGCRKDRT